MIHYLHHTKNALKAILLFFFVLTASSDARAQSPGDVNDLAIWLRADNGVILGASNTVQRWNDATGNFTRYALQSLTANRPTVIPQVINGHNVVRFDGSNDYMNMNVISPFLSGDCSIFVVITPREDTDVGYYLSTHSLSDDLFKAGHKLTGELVYDNNVPVLWSEDMHDKTTIVSMQMEQDFYIEGYVNATLAAPWTSNFTNSGAIRSSLGQDYDGTTPANFWKGDMAEVIIFDRLISAAESDQVHSYLNVRYGINIPVANHNFYDQIDYPYNIAGLGQAVNQNLDQTDSKSEEVGAVVSMSMPSNLDEGEYLVWGNDGSGTATINSEMPSNVTERIQREWRVTETGELGTVSVSFDLAELGIPGPYLASDYAILIDSNDGDFSDAVSTNTGASINGSIVTFTDVMLEDGDWFTLATGLNAADACVSFDIKVILEGPYNTSSGEMNTGLNIRGLLPGQTPIGGGLAVPTPDGQPYNTAPWNYAGTEGAGWGDADYSSDAVDWILISARTSLSKNTEIGQTAALLLKDGTVRMIDDCPIQNFSGAAHILVQHRNHMATITLAPVNVTNGALSYDFTANNTAAGTYAGQKFVGGKYCLYGGDGYQFDAGGYDIKGSDANIWATGNGTFDIYQQADFKMDGDVNGADKNVWTGNNGISTPIDR